MRLPDDPAIAAIFTALPGARLVGGCVRDALAGRASADIDIATPHKPEETQQRLAQAGIKTIATGLAHGTITAIIEGRPIEITTLRRDVETDGRHAKVAWTDDFQEDAARRDFTINAMSLDANGQLHDYFNGETDLKQGRVRFVGDAATRIREDHLRALRFFRFQARYGASPPDAEATSAIATHLDGLKTLSAERVWSELEKLLALPDPTPTIQLMHQLGVLATITPEATNTQALARLTKANAPPDPILRLAALTSRPSPPPLGESHGGEQQPEALATRLKLSNAERDRLQAMLTAPTPPPNADDITLTQLLADTPADILQARLWLTNPSQAIARLATLTRPIFPLEGRHALALGAKPGPAIGEALRQVRAWWLAAGCHPTKEQCQEQLARALGAPPA